MIWRVSTLVLCGSLMAQQPAGVKFQTSTQLVIQTVTVKGKDGKPIEGLTAQDFVLTEDGKPQTIAFCEYQKLRDLSPLPEPVHEPDATPPERASPKYPPDNSDRIRYRDRRLLALYFDMTSMAAADRTRALAAAERFIQTQMTSQDLMAVLAYSGAAVQVIEDFTVDREELSQRLRNLFSGAGPLTDSDDAADDSNADDASPFGQNDGEMAIFTTDRQLAALQTAVQKLSSIQERKSLVFFASGLRLTGLNNQAQLQAVINAAIRSNVLLYPIDARGLVAQAPLGDATHASPGGAGMYTGASALSAAEGLSRSQDTLYTLAADTGGQALLNSNDLAAGIVQAQRAVSSHYILGYYTTNTELDGKFRRVKVSLKDSTAKLEYRPGFYAGKQFGKLTAADKERQLEEALMLGDPIVDLAIAMEVDYFRLNRAEYYVPVAIKIPAGELASARRGGSGRTVVDFIGEIKDAWGQTVQNVRDKVDIRLPDEAAAQMEIRPVEYETGFTLIPGRYTIKFLARDAETGRIGTYLNKFVIPNLNRDTQRVLISSVVLSSQKVDLKNALYTAQGAALGVDPLVSNGTKLIPNVTRVFSRNGEMYVYLEGYELDADPIRPLGAFVSLYRGSTKVLQTPIVSVREPMPARRQTVPIRLTVPLVTLRPGRYRCQVTVVDPGQVKATFWQGPILLVQ